MSSADGKYSGKLNESTRDSSTIPCMEKKESTVQYRKVSMYTF